MGGLSPDDMQKLLAAASQSKEKPQLKPKVPEKDVIEVKKDLKLQQGLQQMLGGAAATADVENKSASMIR